MSRHAHDVRDERDMCKSLTLRGVALGLVPLWCVESFASISLYSSYYDSAEDQLEDCVCVGAHEKYVLLIR